MWLLKESSVATIAVLGAILAMVSPETDIGHRNEDSVESTTTNIPINSVRCVGKLEIEPMPHDAQRKNPVGIDDSGLRISSICKWNRREKLVANINGKQQFSTKSNFTWSSINSLRKLVNDDARIRHGRSIETKSMNITIENVTMSVVEIKTTYKPTDDETTNITASTVRFVNSTGDIDSDIVDVLVNKQNLSLSQHENQVMHIDKLEMKRDYKIAVSTSDSIIQSRSSRHGVPSNITVITSTENSSDAPNYAIESMDGTMEIPPPLIIPSSSSSSSSSASSTSYSSPRSLSKWQLSKEKSLDTDDGKQQPYLKKAHSKASINLIDRKVNKIFYEIKPSLNTAMDDQDDDMIMGRTNSPIITTTKRNLFADFKLPRMPSSVGKFGPYFLDEVYRQNVTERIGSTVMLDCKIGLLGDKKVTWLQHDKDSIRLLTVGNVQYSADERISLKFQYPGNWRLQIAYATLRDSGLYMCQVEIDPTHSLVRRYNVIITAPFLNITDDSGRVISGERHLKAGSALRLRCEGRDVLERLNESVLWTKGDETLTSNVSENRTTEIVDDREISVIVSTLTVERATPRHAGNYSCTVPERAKTTIAVHVLNGELPAAVHHGNGVSRAFLNLWLIHLTISHGLFR